MTSECHSHELEIAAAAGGDLLAETREHLERCAHCAGLRESTLALARTPDIDPSAETASLAIARRAITEATSHRSAYWIAPLLSASATAAGLILYFGLAVADAPADGAQSDVRFPPVTDDTSELLPDDLRALSDTILFPREDAP